MAAALCIMGSVVCPGLLSGTTMHSALELTLRPILLVQSHQDLVAGVQDLAKRVQCDRELTALIRRKFAIKCTTGDLAQPLVSPC